MTVSSATAARAAKAAAAAHQEQSKDDKPTTRKAAAVATQKLADGAMKTQKAAAKPRATTVTKIAEPVKKPSESPQSIVKSIYAENLTKEYDDAVKTIEEDLRCTNQFILELLQNAHDAAQGLVSLTVRVLTEKTDKFVIFSHTGEHFSKEDVHGISGWRQKTKKSQDPTKGGVKDVGFKSVYILADYVLICSREFMFRFDPKGHADEKAAKGKWWFLPQWTEKNQIPGSILQHLDTERVHFVLRLKRDKLKDTQQALEDILSKSNTLLFLSNFQEVQYFDHEMCSVHFKIREEKEMRRIDNLVQRNHRSFFSHCSRVSLSSDTIDALKREYSYELPEKLLNREHVDITLMIRYNATNKKLMPEPGLFYVLLPTSENFQLPLYIDCPFLLETNRKHLQSNCSWNSFLITQVPRLWLEFLSLLAQKGDFWKSVLTLLALPISSKDNKDYLNQFKKALAKAYQEIPFIASCADPKKLITLHGSSVDRTGFLLKFHREVQEDVGHFLHTELEGVDFVERNINKLRKEYDLQIDTYEFEQLKEDIQSYVEQAQAFLGEEEFVDFQKQLLNYLIEKDQSEAMSFAEVQDLPILLTSDGELKGAQELFLPGVDPKFQTEVTNLEVEEIYFLDSALISAETQEWLERQTRGEFCILNFLKMIVKSIKRGIDKEKSEKIIAFLYEHIFVRKSIKLSTLKSDEFGALGGLVVETENPSVDRCVKDLFLTSNYHTKDDFKTIFSDPKDNHWFISEKWVTGCSDEQIGQWRTLFVVLGATGAIQYVNEEQTREAIDQGVKRTSRLVQKSKRSLVDDYFSSVHSKQGILSAHIVKPFVTCDLIELLISEQHRYYEGYCEIFWRLVLKNFKSEHRTAFYQMAGNSKSCPSFLFYVLTTKPCIKGTDKKFHSSKELYPPEMQELFRNVPSLGVVADLPIAMTPLQATCLGFKALAVDKLLEILAQVDTLEREQQMPQLAVVFRYLAEHAHDFQPEELTKLKRWKGNLLACDHKFYSKDKIRFSTQELVRDHTDPLLIDLHNCGQNISRDQMLTAILLLDIKPATAQTYQVINQDKFELDDYLPTFLKRILAIATCEAHYRMSTIETQMEDLYQRICQIEFWVNMTHPAYVRVGVSETTATSCKVYSSKEPKKMLYFCGRPKDKFYEKLAELIELTRSTSLELEQLFAADDSKIDQFLRDRAGESYSQYQKLKEKQNNLITELQRKRAPDSVKKPGGKKVEILTDRENDDQEEDENPFAADNEAESVPETTACDHQQEDEKPSVEVAKKATLRIKVPLEEVEIDEIEIEEWQPQVEKEDKQKGKTSKIKLGKKTGGMTDEEKMRVGLLAEGIFYKKLKRSTVEKYQDEEKYSAFASEETLTGYVITCIRTTDELKKKIEIIWHNKGRTESTAHHYDMKVRKSTETETSVKKKKEYYEVKGTTSAVPNLMKLSLLEYAFMMKHRKDWQLVRVYKVGEAKNPPIAKISAEKFLEHLRRDESRFGVEIKL